MSLRIFSWLVKTRILHSHSFFAIFGEGIARKNSVSRISLLSTKRQRQLHRLAGHPAAQGILGDEQSHRSLLAFFTFYALSTTPSSPEELFAGIMTLQRQGGCSMTYHQITIDIPESVLLAEKMDAASFGRQMRLLTAIKLYELGRLSSGRAAELAGLSRVEFLLRLGEYQVFPLLADLESLEAGHE